MGASGRHGASTSWPKTPGDTKAKNRCRVKALSVVSQDDADPSAMHAAHNMWHQRGPSRNSRSAQTAGVGDGLPRDQASPR